MYHLVVILFLLSVVIPSSSMGAQVYTWIDENGKKHFSDQPPTDPNISAEIKEDVKLQNIDSGYPAGIVLDPGRKQREETKVAERKAIAKDVEMRCSTARKELETLSGRVTFQNDEGEEVRVSEKERDKMARSLRSAIRKNCP